MYSKCKKVTYVKYRNNQVTVDTITETISITHKDTNTQKTYINANITFYI